MILLHCSDRESLDAFVSDNFPASSREYPVGSPRYNEYIGALDKVTHSDNSLIVTSNEGGGSNAV